MLAWVSFTIVVLKGVFDLDAYRLISVAWLTANLLLGRPSSRWQSGCLNDSPAVRALMKDLAGNNLNTANVFLAELSPFEDEER
jgi:hypothetical protein